MSKTLNNILLLDKKVRNGNFISFETLEVIDKILISSKVSCEVYNLFEKFAQIPQTSVNDDLIKAFRNYSQILLEEKKYPDALLLYRFLITKSQLIPADYFNIGKCCYYSSFLDITFVLLDYYEKLEQNKQFVYLDLANFFNLEVQNFNKAIYYYQKYLEYDSSRAIIYTTLAGLHKKTENYSEYIKSLLCAFKITPNDRSILQELAFAYEHLFDFQNAKYYYEKLLLNNPTDNDYFNYGCLLISMGDLLLGHKYFTKRSNKFFKDIPLEKRWYAGCDITGKKLLITYEQGFGDTFMYCRLLPFLKTYTSNINFYAQDELFELLKNSSIISKDIKIISNKQPLSEIEYDINIPIFDLMYILKISKSNMPLTQGYIDISTDSVEAFKKNYIKPTNKLKIGIAYEGDINANYYGRDLKEEDFYQLVNNIDADFYSLQYGKKTSNPKITPLGVNFKNFSDTASAIKNMDLIISTDNAVLNLAGAIGIETLGLFNKKTNFRWYNTDNDNVGYYDKVKAFKCIEQDKWDDVFTSILSYINHG